MPLPNGLLNAISDPFAFTQEVYRFATYAAQLEAELEAIESESIPIAAMDTQLALEAQTLAGESAALQARWAALNAEQTELITKTNTHNANPPSPFNWPAIRSAAITQAQPDLSDE